jgi:hypothetical protein
MRMAFIGFALLLAFERAAAACPFCGGKGASGLLENLLLVAALWFGARALMRSLQRRRQKEPPPERDASNVG